MAILQLKLDKIKKQKEWFDQMKVRVSKQNSSSANKTSVYYYNKKVDDKLDDVDDKDNNLKDKDTEDRDLLLEECEDKDDDQECEETVEEEVDDRIKVFFFNTHKI